MSRATSPSGNKPYGVARVTKVWGLPRSTYYLARERRSRPRTPGRRGPRRISDEALVAETGR